MAFELEHDWQANLATPRARVGERVKVRLLIVLCFVWVVMGLVSHQPWKPDESVNISIVKQMLTGHFVDMTISPVAVAANKIEAPPLYYLSAAGLAFILKPVFAMHDAARLVSGVWMALTLLLVGMMGRELWGVGSGRQTALIFLGSLGLLVVAHVLTPVVSALTGSAMAFYALALANRRPFRASVLLGCGIGIAYLSTGLTSALCAVITALILPLIFKVWRTSRYMLVLALASLVASPFLLIWSFFSWQQAPDLWLAWWQSNLPHLKNFHDVYYLRTLLWFTWPALPIAIWGLWRYREYLLHKPKFQLILVFFLVNLCLICLRQDTRDIYALPLLLPLAVLAGGSLETLKRSTAVLLNWFGLMLFGSIGFLIWLGWFAMISGWPVKLSGRMHILSGIVQPMMSWPAFFGAFLITVAWFMVINNYRHSNRATVTDWAVGITMSWSLLMALWLPWIDNAKGYATVMHSMQAAMPKQFACVTSRNLGMEQASLLHYYTDLHVQAFETVQRLGCDLYLIQDERDRDKVDPGHDWKLIWEGKRPAERRESFRLFQHN